MLRQHPFEQLHVPRREEFEEHYGYHPPAFTGKPVQLGINWSEVKSNALPAHNAAGAHFTEAAGVPSGSGRMRAVLAETTISSSLGELTLSTAKEMGSTQSLYVRLTKPVTERFDLHDEDESVVGNLILRKTEDTWDLKHRWVQRRFENQPKESVSVGRVLLETAEQAIQGYANETGRSQTIIAEAGQLNVITWLYKSGYEPMTEDDRRKLQMLFTLSDELTIQDIPNTDPDSGFGKWCMYPKETARIIAEGGQVDPVDSQLRIKLKKSIPCSEDSVAKHDDVNVKEIRSLF